MDVRRIRVGLIVVSLWSAAAIFTALSARALITFVWLPQLLERQMYAVPHAVAGVPRCAAVAALTVLALGLMLARTLEREEPQAAKSAALTAIGAGPFALVFGGVAGGALCVLFMMNALEQILSFGYPSALDAALGADMLLGLGIVVLTAFAVCGAVRAAARRCSFDLIRLAFVLVTWLIAAVPALGHSATFRRGRRVRLSWPPPPSAGGGPLRAPPSPL